MTPRAAATNALGGAVPKRAGVVVDLTPMSKRIDIDEEQLTVTADAGVVIRAIQTKLLEVGLELPCYPTSMNAATIGGFVAMDGHGIHSTANGNIGRHVVAAEGVGMDGQRFKARSPDELDLLVGLGGSTGILTTVTIKCVEATRDKPVLAVLPSLRALGALLLEAKERFPVKHIMFHNPDFFALRSEALGKKKNPYAGKHVAFLCLREPQWGGVAERVQRAIERHGGTMVEGAEADEEWAGRLFPIRAKRLGPSLVAGEVFVPLDKTVAYLTALRSVAHKELSVEGHVTDDGRVYFFIFALDDERRPTYPLGWGTSSRILLNAKRFGGTAYHPGVWLQFQAKSVFGKMRYRRLKTLKRGGDRRHLMNPGMCFPYPAPVPEFVFKLAVLGPIPAPSLGFQLAAGDPILIAQDKMLPYRRHKTLGVRAADIAADMARPGYALAKHSDMLWGCDLASAQAIPNDAGLPMTQTVRGKMVLAKAYATGKIVDPWSLKPALDVADPTADAAAALCPEIPQILATLDAFRAAVQEAGVELQVKAVEVKKVEKAGDGHADVAKTGAKKVDVEAIQKQAAATPEEKKAWVLAVDCIVCNGCEAACPTNAAIVTDIARVDRDLCIADGACFDACPTDAIRPGAEDKATSAGWPEGSRLAGKFGV
jgi:FAD/FMN-containing dehydrogenase/ferredoxin